MERACCTYSRSITSRKHPYASLDRRIEELAILSNISNIYNLHSKLPRYTRMNDAIPPPTFRLESYPELKLLHPRHTFSFKDDGLLELRKRVAVHLSTQLETTVAAIKNALPADFVSWSRIQVNNSDIVYAFEAYRSSEQQRRDATFMEYEQVVDRMRHRRRAAPVFQGRTFFGQLQRIFVIDLPASETLGLREATSYILLDVHLCNTTLDRYGFAEYTQFGVQEVVDGRALRALVGRIRDHGRWTFVQRRGEHQTADYTDADEI